MPTRKPRVALDLSDDEFREVRVAAAELGVSRTEAITQMIRASKDAHAGWQAVEEMAMAERARGRSNAAEHAFSQAAKAAGWNVSRRGWPDFFMWRNGRLACVEVKPYGTRKLKVTQQRVLEALAAFGVPCYRWSPDSGFKPIYGTKRHLHTAERPHDSDEGEAA